MLELAMSEMKKNPFGRDWLSPLIEIKLCCEGDFDEDCIDLEVRKMD